ncbi:MAG: cysteine hydrolase [Hyphomicrobiales bacterium]|nr:cysteine hydrolase [Hyphomicrobiales bacterium]
MSAAIDPDHTALFLLDLQNDFLHPEGAYGRAGQSAPALAALPARIAPLVQCASKMNLPIISSHFTLVPGKHGEPLISPHLKQMRPFLGKGDFLPGSWGHGVVDDLAPSDYQVEKVAFSAFYMTRLDWLIRKLDIRSIIATGLVTNGGVASTVRDAHVRDLDVVVAEDGCAAFLEDTHRTAIDSLRPVARIATIGDIIAELS